MVISNSHPDILAENSQLLSLGICKNWTRAQNQSVEFKCQSHLIIYTPTYGNEDVFVLYQTMWSILQRA
jgi:hypothetical protein